MLRGGNKNVSAQSAISCFVFFAFFTFALCIFYRFSFFTFHYFVICGVVTVGVAFLRAHSPSGKGRPIPQKDAAGRLQSGMVGDEVKTGRLRAPEQHER